MKKDRQNVNHNSTKRKPFYLVPKAVLDRSQENIIKCSVRISRAKRKGKKNPGHMIVHADNLSSVNVEQ